jgi:hypothetical protein
MFRFGYNFTTFVEVVRHSSVPHWIKATRAGKITTPAPVLVLSIKQPWATTIPSSSSALVLPRALSSSSTAAPALLPTFFFVRVR